MEPLAVTCLLCALSFSVTVEVVGDTLSVSTAIGCGWIEARTAKGVLASRSCFF